MRDNTIEDIHTDEYTVYRLFSSLFSEIEEIHIIPPVFYNEGGNKKELADLIIETDTHVFIIQMKNAQVTKNQLGTEVNIEGVDGNEVIAFKPDSKNWIKNTVQNIERAVVQLDKSIAIYESNIKIDKLTKGKTVIGIVLFSEGTDNANNINMGYCIEKLDIMYNMNKISDKYYIISLYAFISMLTMCYSNKITKYDGSIIDIDDLLNFLNYCKRLSIPMDEITFYWYFILNKYNANIEYSLLRRNFDIHKLSIERFKPSILSIDINTRIDFSEYTHYREFRSEYIIDTLVMASNNIDNGVLNDYTYEKIMKII